MKGYALTTVLFAPFLLAVALASSCQQVYPPTCDEQSLSTSYHAHETFCELFYRCDHGKKTVFSCPSGQRFDSDLKICESEHLVECNRCSPSVPEEGILSGLEPKGVCPETPTCGILELGKKKPYPPDCTKYIYCDESGNELLSVCQNGTHFSPHLLYCTNPAEARCPLCEVSTTTVTTPSVATTIGICPDSPKCKIGDLGLTLPYPPDCKMFLYCDESGDEILSICPNGTNFNPELRYCTSPDIANCPTCIVLTTTEAQTTTVGICPQPEACTVAERGLTKPYPSDCTMYIYCDEFGNDILSICRAGTHFSPTLLYCTDPETAKCPFCEVLTTTTVVETTTLTVTTTPDFTTTIGFCPPTPTCSASDFGLLKPYPPDCSQYIYCDDLGNSILSVCAVGTHFNPTLLHCMDPNIANCPLCEVEVTTIPSTTVTEEITTTVEISTTIGICPATPTCSVSDFGKLKPYPPDCSMYIYCDGLGNSILSVCSVGNHFSPILLRCMDSNSANCPYCEVEVTTVISTTVTEEITTTTEISTTIGICPSIPTCTALDFGITKPYPPDCTKYIYCEGEGTGYVSVCPSGKHFSPQLLYCLDAELAGCPLCEVLAETTIEVTTTVAPTTEYSSTTILICPDIQECGPLEFGRLKPYPSDCSKYIYCTFSSYFIRVCPNDYQFSPTLNRCMPPAEANCPYCIEVTTTVPSTTPIEITTTVEISTTVGICPATPICGINEIGVTKEYPPDCSMYIYCDKDGEIKLSVCPTGLHYSPSEHFCQDPGTANCPFCEVLTTTTEAETTTEEETTTVITSSTIGVCPETPTCLANETGYFKPFPPDCTQYIYCEREEALLSSCPVGEHFSPSEFFCMEPDLANCPYCEVETTSTTVITSSTIPECPPIPTCGELEHGQTKPYPPDCSKYVYCSTNTSFFIRVCPSGYHFSPSLGRCASPEEANCPFCLVETTPVSPETSSTEMTTEGSTVTDSTTEVASTTIGICPETPVCGQFQFGVFKPYPPDCSMFILCLGFGSSIMLPCPAGQQFSPINNTCMPEAEANCPLCMEETTLAPVTTEAPSTTSTMEITTTEEVTSTEMASTTIGICPETPTCRMMEIFVFKPVPSNCSLYLVCFGFGLPPSILPCPAGEHFSPTANTCMPEAEANCPYCTEETTPAPTTEVPSTTEIITTTPTTIEITTTEEITSTEPATTTVDTTTAFVCPPYPTCVIGIDDYFRKPIPDNCFRYVYCDPINGLQERPCPRMQHFSPTELRCMDPSIAKCVECTYPTTPAVLTSTTELVTPLPTFETTEQSTTTVLDTTIITPCVNHVCSLIDNGLMFPYVQDCTKYIYCDFGISKIRNCISAQHFSPTALKCMDPLEANCKNCVEPTTVAPEITTTEPALPPCAPIPTCTMIESGVRKSYPPDCSKYILCGMAGFSIENCSTGQHFSPTDYRCMSPELANCPVCTPLWWT